MLLLKVSASLIIFSTVLGGGLMATTECDRTFVLLGMTKGDTATLAFSEEVPGDCYTFKVHRLQFVDGAVSGVEEVRHNELTLPLWGTGSEAGQKLEYRERLHRVGDRFEGRTVYDITMQPPQFDSIFSKHYKDSVAFWCGAPGDWRSRFEACDSVETCFLDDPVCSRTLELLYFYPGGLYKNYEIAEAWHFSNPSILVLITHQPLICLGLHTLHGVLIYRLGEIEK